MKKLFLLIFVTFLSSLNAGKIYIDAIESTSGKGTIFLQHSLGDVQKICYFPGFKFEEQLEIGTFKYIDLYQWNVEYMSKPIVIHTPAGFQHLFKYDWRTTEKGVWFDFSIISYNSLRQPIRYSGSSGENRNERGFFLDPYKDRDIHLKLECEQDAVYLVNVEIKIK